MPKASIESHKSTLRHTTTSRRVRARRLGVFALKKDREASGLMDPIDSVRKTLRRDFSISNAITSKRSRGIKCASHEKRYPEGIIDSVIRSRRRGNRRRSSLAREAESRKCANCEIPSQLEPRHIIPAQESTMLPHSAATSHVAMEPPSFVALWNANYQPRVDVHGPCRSSAPRLERLSRIVLLHAVAARDSAACATPCRMRSVNELLASKPFYESLMS